MEPLVAPCLLTDNSAPYYFSALFVRLDSSYQSILELSGGVFGYNDEYSLSGYHCMKIYLKALVMENAHALEVPFFKKQVRTGSHANSISALCDGTVDVVAIDCNVLAKLKQDIEWQEKLSRLRMLHISKVSMQVLDKTSGAQHICHVATDGLLGPHPSQPIVAAKAVDQQTKKLFKNALLNLDCRSVAHLGISGYFEVDEGFYLKTKLLLDLVRHDRIAECSSLYSSPNDVRYLCTDCGISSSIVD